MSLATPFGIPNLPPFRFVFGNNLGTLVVDDKGQVIFGEALTNAHVLERKSVRYPRVVISLEAHKLLTEHGPLKGPFADATYKNIFARDRDGFWRLNPFAGLFVPDQGFMADYLDGASATIVRTLGEFPPGSEEFAKAHWLAEIFNEELDRIIADSSHRVQGIEPIDLASLRNRRL